MNISGKTRGERQYFSICTNPVLHPKCASFHLLEIRTFQGLDYVKMISSNTEETLTWPYSCPVPPILHSVRANAAVQQPCQKVSKNHCKFSFYLLDALILSSFKVKKNNKNKLKNLAAHDRNKTIKNTGNRG